MLLQLPLNYIEEIIDYGNPNIHDAIECYFRSNFSKLTIGQFFRNSWSLSDKIVSDFHNYLKYMPMCERDLRYIRLVNRNYEIYQRTLSQEYQEVKEDCESNALRKLMFFAWNCITSHPDFKAILIRQMVKTLVKYPNLCIKFLDLFGDVNDDYIKASVLCAIYGVLLVVRDKSLNKDISQKVFDLYYSPSAYCPRNILVRQWSELILDFCNSFSDSSNRDYQNLFPCKNTENPLTWDISDVNPDILGDTKGGKRLKYNLFRCGPLPSDFNRYILGSNSSLVNRHFRKMDGSAILIDDLSKMIAKELINLGWNDDLGNIDTMDPPFERYDNMREKIGKKYLWIAYQNVMALLSDHCRFSYDSIYSSSNDNPNFIKHFNAWMIEGHSYFDPTLLVHKDVSPSLPNLKFKSDIESLPELVESSGFPKAILSNTDDKGNEWIQIDGWDNWRVAENDYYGHSAHIQIVSWIVKGISQKRLESVIKDGINWDDMTMPYDSLYGCLWNEIPWSKRSKDKYKWEKLCNSRGKHIPMRINQLQEEMSGIDYENQPISNAMTLNWEWLEKGNLYNAERGICRSKIDGGIVAYNRTILEKGCSGLIVRRSEVDSYLENENGLMLTAIEYYKSNPVKGWREYEWLIYTKDIGFKSIARFKEND